MNTSKQIHALNEHAGIGVWQRNYHEHIIRDNDALDRISQYIINNPKNWDADLESLAKKGFFT